MNTIECFFYCIQNAGLLYPLIGLLALVLIFGLIFIFKRNYESLLASQFFMTIIISLNLLSMNCHMFYWFWIYLGIILIGTILLGFVKVYLNLKLDKNIFRLPTFLSDIGNRWNVDIRILNSQRIKAFAYKDKVYLSVGLIERLEKDEIKSVVAHEVYHLKHSPSKFISSLLAITSLTFRRFRDEYRADRYAAETIGFKNLINAFKKLQIKDAEKRINQL
jgi:heat shock protein HtpX